MELSLEFTTSYLVAFAMGLFSSLHCIGMCGSIIGTLTLSLDIKIRSKKSSLSAYVLNYNLGRVSSYTIAGLLGGLISSFVVDSFAASYGNRALQLLSSLVIASAGLYIGGWFPRFAYIEKLGVHIWKKLEPFGHRLIPVKSKTNAYLFGMIWGWLPCGLVYAALSLAVSTGDSLRSGMTMLAFGLGTLPSVMCIGIITSAFLNPLRKPYVKHIVGIMMLALAFAAAFPWLYPMRIQHH